MTYGEKPEASPDNSPVTAAFKANFIRGGLVFNMHHHHFSNDVMGWAGLTHQLAENCYAIINQSEFPIWDPHCLDVSRLIKQSPLRSRKRRVLLRLSVTLITLWACRSFSICLRVRLPT
ncbi:hypothetical protein QQZ08_005689 [Neonectria magnoliae]|uniref:Uncharacterized protein n=1 Tax=Neonectria magnoliae TaxID=2732573 RepID=A0ABR1I2P3_9HYPO